MKLKYLIFTLLLNCVAFAQSKQIFKGKVYDSTDQSPLSFATVYVKDTDCAIETDEDGNFELTCNNAKDNITLIASYLGYSSKEVFTGGRFQDSLVFALEPEDNEIDQVVITVNKNKSNESYLLQQQQRSVEIKQNIGAEELSKKGVGDAATAVAKTTGIAKQEGSSNVFVRGLGDRYNATYLNGLPIPSNDPEKKNINLELFSTDIIEYISIDKVFNTRSSGDFGGGTVDIFSKDFNKESLFEIKIGSKINTNAIQKDGFALPQGSTYFGHASHKMPENPLTGYRFQNSLSPKSVFPLGTSFGVNAGKSYSWENGRKLNLFATINFDNGYQYREGLNQSMSAQGARLKSFQQEKHNYSTNTTGMFNANYHFNYDHKIGYNFLYINSSDLSRDIYTGYDRDLGDEENARVQRGTFIQNTLLINQLLGNHKLNKRTNFDWALSYNNIKSDMPDRMQNKMILRNGVYNLAQYTITDNHRYYQNLNEDELAANLALSYKLGLNEYDEARGKITLGYNGRMKKRAFEAIQFNFRINGNELTQAVNPDQLDLFFNQQNYANNWFKIESFAGMTPQTYNGEQNINAAFANLEYRLSDRLSTIVGLRFEKISQTVDWRTQLDAEGGKNTFERNEFLPNLILKYELAPSQNLRLAASKTYTLPQFKERALFIYEDVTEIKIGNPSLYPSQNYNVDLKWEMFPQNDEVISVTAFGKYIKDPINEITLASSTNDISFINTGDKGYAYGAEFEIKKNLFTFGVENTEKISAGMNISYLKTTQDLDSEKVKRETKYNTNLTDKKAGFTGAADLLLNADISYQKNWQNNKNLMATLSYAYNSDRLYALGVEGKGNLVDKGIGSLDFILKTKLHKNFGIDFTAKNLLNPEFRRVQENANGHVNALTYKRGTFIGLSAKFIF